MTNESKSQPSTLNSDPTISSLCECQNCGEVVPDFDLDDDEWCSACGDDELEYDE